MTLQEFIAANPPDVPQYNPFALVLDVLGAIWHTYVDVVDLLTGDGHFYSIVFLMVWSFIFWVINQEDRAPPIVWRITTTSVVFMFTVTSFTALAFVLQFLFDAAMLPGNKYCMEC